MRNLCHSLQPDRESSDFFLSGEMFIFIFPTFSWMQKPRKSEVGRRLYKNSGAISATQVGRIIWCKDRANEDGSLGESLLLFLYT